MVMTLFCLFDYRMMLQKEKREREEIEKQRRELEERLRRYEEEFQNAQKGPSLSNHHSLETYADKVITTRMIRQHDSLAYYARSSVADMGITRKL